MPDAINYDGAQRLMHGLGRTVPIASLMTSRLADIISHPQSSVVSALAARAAKFQGSAAQRHSAKAARPRRQVALH